MEVSLKNYKNIESLDLAIEDGKVNHIFGISGSGKSSIAKALSSVINQEDVSVGKMIEDCKVKVNGSEVDISGFSIYDLENSKKIIFNNDQDSNIYDVLFSDDNSLIDTINECNLLMSSFEEFKNALIEYKNKIDIVLNHFDVKLKSNNTEFRETSKFIKLTKDLSEIKSNKYINVINNKGADYISWIIDGGKYRTDDICPYCEKKISTTRNEFISTIIKLTPKNFEIITKDNHFLESIGIKTPNYRHSREVERAKRELIEAYNFKEEICSIIELFEDYKTSKLDINKIQQIRISRKIQKVFPNQIEIITNINNNISQIKTKLAKIKSTTNKIIKKNKDNVNKYLGLMGIPYEFCESIYDVDKRTASYSLFLKEDEERKDRKSGLSFGEKNIVSLILFLLGNKSKVLLIDDPASSYDEYRRGLMFKMIYEFQNDRTILLFSHDQIFVKYATLYKFRDEKTDTKRNKNIKEKTGVILQYSNYNHNSILRSIEIDDFDSLWNQTKQFIKNNNMSYYRKIINIRILSEIDKNKSNNYKQIYKYCSAILHNIEKEVIYEQLNSLGIDEQHVISLISNKYKIELETIPDDYFDNVRIDELSNFEKIYYFREILGKYSYVYSELLNVNRFQKSDVDLLKTEFDSIVHLNEKLFVSLNPYKFDYFSPLIYNIITKPIDR